MNLYVGPDNVHFAVHKDLLCNRVPYFHSMFHSRFQEGLSNKATFPEDDVDAFDVLLGWVYFDNIRVIERAESTSTALEKSIKTITDLLTTTTVSDDPPLTWSPITAYSLADKFCIPELMDRIMDQFALAIYTGAIPITPQLFREAYTAFPSANKIRDYIARLFRWVADREIPSRNKSCSVEGLAAVLSEHVDLSVDVIRLRRSEPMAVEFESMHACSFHCHEDNDCYLLKEAQK